MRRCSLRLIRKEIIGNPVEIRSSTHYCDPDEISLEESSSPLIGPIGKVRKSRAKGSQETCLYMPLTPISWG